jgi:hypothetical protein
MTRLQKAGLLAAILTVMGLASCNQAHASIIVYTDRASFTAATSSLTTIDFNGIAPANSYNAYGTGPLTLSGVTFTGNGSMYIIDPGYYGFSYGGGGFLNSDYNPPNTVMAASLPSGTTAFGTDYGGLFSGGSTTFVITLSTGDTVTATTTKSVQGGSLDFVGITSTTAITSVSLAMPDSPYYNAIDNFSFGTAAPVPEPGSLTLLGVGAFGLIGYSWRRKRKVLTAKDDRRSPSKSPSGIAGAFAFGCAGRQPPKMGISIRN